jgi:hypothetical protein
MKEAEQTAILIVSTSMTPIEIAASFLSILAYPQTKKERTLYYGALIYHGYSAINENVGYGMAIRGLTHYINKKCHSEALAILKRGGLVINRERLIAAKMAWPEVHAAVADELG